MEMDRERVKTCSFTFTYNRGRRVVAHNVLIVPKVTKTQQMQGLEEPCICRTRAS